ATNLAGWTANGWHLWQRAADRRPLAALRTELTTHTHQARRLLDRRHPACLVIHLGTELGAFADRLALLTTYSRQVLDAVSGLLATTSGYDGEIRIDRDEIAWATSRGGQLHIIEHADGSVTFTKRHHDGCPFIISAGARSCPDDGCLFDDPYTTPVRRPGQ
ncbi:hypothetical protein FNH05_36570, partial [Amycolatopsis rhizosphaerae]